MKYFLNILVLEMTYDQVFFFFFPGGGGSQNEGCSKEFAFESKMDMVDGLKDSDNHK